MKQTEILKKPFDLETHKKNFINYLEVVVLENGVIEYAVPSHQEKLIAISCEKLKISRQELFDKCPVEYYFDLMTWLTGLTNTISVWNDRKIGKPNEKQKEVLELLSKEGLFSGNCY